MATTKNFGLAGVGTSVQYGKGGGSLAWDSANNRFTASDNSGNLSAIQVEQVPTDPNSAASKFYVDSVASGLDVKNSCRVISTANITLSGTQTVDGVTLAVGDRILVAGQTDATTNGIYVVASGAWMRSNDANNDPDGQAAATVQCGMFTFIEEGTHAQQGWILTTKNNTTINNVPCVNLGSTTLTFSQFTGTGQLQAGPGISISNGTISTVVDGTTIVVGPSGLSVASAYTSSITASIAAETARAMTAEASLAASISATASAGSTADASLAASVVAEAAVRSSADASLAAAIAAETAARSSADASLATAISNVTSGGTSANASLAAALAAETARAEAAETALGAAASTADASLAASISAVAAAGSTADASLAASVAAETARAESAEASLAASISTVTSGGTSADASLAASIAAEAATRATADASLAASIAANAAAGSTADASLASSVAAETARAMTAEGSLAASVVAEAAVRSTADASLAASIAAVAAAGSSADASLAAQISSQISNLGSVFNYVSTITVPAGTTQGTPYALTVTATATGDYYKVIGGGWVSYGTTTSIFANVNDGIVFNNAGGIDVIAAVDGATVSGTSGQIDVTGSLQTGFTVSIDPAFVASTQTAIASANATLSAAIAAEAAARSTADASLAASIASVTSVGTSADASLAAALAAEAAVRSTADASLAASIAANAAAGSTADASLASSVAAETARAETAEASLAASIAAVAAAGSSAEASLAASIAAVVSASASTTDASLSASIAAETARAESAEASLAASIAANAAAGSTSDASLAASVVAEAAVRSTADASLAASIAAVAAAGSTADASLAASVAAVSAAMSSADASLSAQISSQIANLGAVFDYVTTFTPGTQTSPFDMTTLTPKTPGSYYKALTGGYIVDGTETLQVNANDGVVFNTAGGVDVIAAVDGATVSGTAGQIDVTGDLHVGFTVAIDPAFVASTQTAIASANATLSAAIAAEAAARSTADASLAASIASVTTSGTSATASLAAALAAETAARSSGDTSLAGSIAANAAAGSTADASLAAAIAAETARATAAENAISAATSTAEASLASSIAAEAAVRSTADASLAASIAAESAARSSADASLAANIATLTANEFEIESSDGNTLVRTMTNATTDSGKVEVWAKGFTDAAHTVIGTGTTHIVDFSPTSGVDAFGTFSSAAIATNHQEFRMEAHSSNGTDDVDIRLVPQGAGNVYIGDIGDGVIQADSDYNLTLKGGDVGTVKAGYALLVGGDGTSSIANGSAIVRPGVNNGVGGGVVNLEDAYSNSVAQFVGSGSSAVNYFQFTNSATGAQLNLAAAGTDTNIDIVLAPKGTGQIVVPVGYVPTATNSVVTKGYVDGAILNNTDVLILRAVATANSSATSFAVGTMPSVKTNYYASKITINVQTAFSSDAGAALVAGSSTIAANTEFDLTTVGIYVIEGDMVTSITGAAVALSGFSSAPTTGSAVIAVEYKGL